MNRREWLEGLVKGSRVGVEDRHGIEIRCVEWAGSTGILLDNGIEVSAKTGRPKDRDYELRLVPLEHAEAIRAVQYVSAGIDWMAKALTSTDSPKKVAAALAIVQRAEAELKALGML